MTNKKGKQYASPFYLVSERLRLVHADFDLPRLGLFGFRNMYLQDAVLVRAWIPSCFTVSGSENDRQNFPLTRSTLRYSAPSVAFSDWRSPVRVSVPSLTSRWKSSFFIPGSSARITYASLLSKTSTGGYQVTEF